MSESPITATAPATHVGSEVDQGKPVGDGEHGASARSKRMDLINVGIVAVLIMALFGLNYVVDPYGANGAVDLGLEKQAVTKKLNYFNWKFAQYRNDPAPVILLGDSRVDAWPTDPFSEALGKKVANLGLGGASATDTFEAFWLAADLGKLERVYLALNLSVLDDSLQRNRARKARQLLDQPLRYYLSPSITRATVKVIGHAMTDAMAADEAPPMSPDAFWKHQLVMWDRITGEHYKPPGQILASLRKVATWCEEHGVKLHLVLNPTHADVAAMREKRGLTAIYEGIKKQLAAMAPTYDFDFAGPLTAARQNFADPFHLDSTTVRMTIKELLAGEGPNLVRVQP